MLSVIILFGLIELLLRKTLSTYGERLKEFPISDIQELEKFSNYDEELGWEPKPTKIRSDSAHSRADSEEAKGKYSINEDGSRFQPSKNINDKYLIEFFGDSSCFCRDVKDNETFEYYLENNFKIGACKNYGVGNYGIDQAYIRAIRRMQGGGIVVLFMPVCSLPRITMVYKQYGEITNHWAVKPRFVIEKEGLRLISRPFKDKRELMNLETYSEYFHRYDKNYNRFKEKNPHDKTILWLHFLKHRDIFYLMRREMERKVENKPMIVLLSFWRKINFVFELIFEKEQKGNKLDNLIKLAKGEEGELFAKICNELNNLCIKRDSKLLVVITPQGKGVDDFEKYGDIVQILKEKLLMWIHIYMCIYAMLRIFLKERTKVKSKNLMLRPPILVQKETMPWRGISIPKLRRLLDMNKIQRFKKFLLLDYGIFQYSYRSSGADTYE